MSKFAEFFEDSDGRKSMSRLVTFGVFLIGAAVMIVLAIMKALTAMHFGIWMGGGSGTYLTGKISDLFDKGGAGNGSPS